MMQHYRSTLSIGLILLLLTGYSHRLSAQPAEAPVIGKSMLKSLVVPGWGERDLGEKNRGNKFLMAEATLWVGISLLNVISNRANDEMVAKAVQQAQIDPQGKPRGYYDDIGNYSNLASYNDQMLRDRNVYLLYPEGEGYEWNWSSEAQRQAFKDIKFRRNLYSQFAIYSLGAVTINHLVSVIDVVWLQQKKITLQAVPLLNGNSPGMAFSLTF